MSYKINKRPKDDHSDDEKSMNNDHVSLRAKLKELEKKISSLEEENHSIKQKYDELNERHQQLPNEKTSSHSTEFWQDVEEKVKNDTEGIKKLIKDNILKVSDANEFGQNLMHFAGFYGVFLQLLFLCITELKTGNLELTKLCINIGYDSRKCDKYGRDPVRHAELGQSHHVAQLLRLSQIKGNIGGHIEEKAKELQRENGMIENVINELSKIDDKLMSFKVPLIQVMINLIKQKLSFPDFLLSLCWKWMERDGEKPDQSELYKTIIQTLEAVIKDNNKRDWFWMKNVLSKSNVWFRRGSHGCLWFNLLNIANEESVNQVKKLADDIKIVTEKDLEAWHQLAEFEVPKERLVGLINPSNEVRQDNIPNGIIYEFDRNSLVQNATNATFDGASFYDLHQYLPKLAINAQILDDAFQRSVATAFNVEKVSNIGTIRSDDEKSDDIKVVYRRSPVKLLERALSKAQNNYYNSEYPTAACILDLNRCSLIFDDINSLLAGLRYFMNKIYGYDCGAIIGIVRSKNGFKDYINEGPQYADIKLNVMIRGKYNLIGEVQFLLRTMTTFKSLAHNLYAIQREEEFMKGSVEKILPSLLDKTKQLNVCAAGGNSKKLAELMVFSNYTINDILTIDGESICIPLCKAGSIKALKFIASMLTEEQIINELFKEGKDDDDRTKSAKRNCIEYAVSKGRIEIIDYILQMDAIKKRYSEDNDMIFRLVANIFIYCGKVELIDIWMQKFGLTKEKIAAMVQYKYPNKESRYRKNKIAYRMVKLNGTKILDKLRQIIGGELFAQICFEIDSDGRNALENALHLDKVEHTKYLLSVPEIKNKLKIKDEDDKENEAVLRRVSDIVYTLLQCESENILDQQWKAFDFDIETIAKSVNYDDDFWWNMTIKHLKKMVSLIGADLFVEEIVKVPMLKVLSIKDQGEYNYVLSMQSEKNKNDEDILQRCLSTPLY